jgi:dolichol kinase
VAIVIRNQSLDDNLSIPIFSGLLMSTAAFIAAI